MTKEQKEAIEYLKEHINYFKEQIKFIEAVDSDYYDEEYEIYKNRAKQFETVLNLIQEQETELQKKDKIIDELAKAFKQDDARSVEEIKQFFERKVKNESNDKPAYG